MNLSVVFPRCSPFSWLPLPLCSKHSFLGCASVPHTTKLTAVAMEISTLLNFLFKASQLPPGISSLFPQCLNSPGEILPRLKVQHVTHLSPTASLCSANKATLTWLSLGGLYHLYHSTWPHFACAYTHCSCFVSPFVKIINRKESHR